LLDELSSAIPGGAQRRLERPKSLFVGRQGGRR